jgi:acyl dehydratase
MELLEQKYFEDMKVGDKCVSVGRTITEADIVNFAGISGDYNILHTDAEYAKTSIAGQRLAHGLLPLVVASGLYTAHPTACR